MNKLYLIALCASIHGNISAIDKWPQFVRSFFSSATQSTTQSSQQGWQLTEEERNSVQTMRTTLTTLESAWNARATSSNNDSNTLIMIKYSNIEPLYTQLKNLYDRDTNNAQNTHDLQLLTQYHENFMEIETLFNQLQQDRNIIVLQQQKAKFEKK